MEADYKRILELVLSLKHMAGKHPQKSHGRGGGGAGKVVGDFNFSKNVKVSSTVKMMNKDVGHPSDVGVTRKLLNPGDIQPSDWNRMGFYEGKVQKMMERDLSEVPPITVTPIAAGGYEVVDGLHRTEVANRQGVKIASLVIPADVYDAVYNFGDTDMEEWAAQL